MDDLIKESTEELEREYVKNTYDNIAEEFSCTRYKKWPKVEAFLQSIPRGSLLLDIGCGNGKYLDTLSSFNLGCDVSSKLLSICRNRGFQVVHCDMMQLPFRHSTFDTIICVAALHHIVTEQRRQRCLENMISLLHDSQSRLLIQVWSYEQDLEQHNPYLKQNKATTDPIEAEVSISDTVKIPIHINRTPFKNQDLLVPFKLKKLPKKANEPLNTDDLSEHQNLRYYHVFKRNELDSMINKIANIKIIDSYYDKGNWCVIIRKVLG